MIGWAYHWEQQWTHKEFVVVSLLFKATLFKNLITCAPIVIAYLVHILQILQCRKLISSICNSNNASQNGIYDDIYYEFSPMITTIQNGFTMLLITGPHLSIFYLHLHCSKNTANSLLLLQFVASFTLSATIGNPNVACTSSLQLVLYHLGRLVRCPMFHTSLATIELIFQELISFSWQEFLQIPSPLWLPIIHSLTP